MMNVLKSLAGSKKFWGAIGTAAAVTLISLVPALEPMEDYITEIVAVGAAYLVGQGIADNGKEAEIVKEK